MKVSRKPLPSQSDADQSQMKNMEPTEKPGLESDTHRSVVLIDYIHNT